MIKKEYVGYVKKAGIIFMGFIVFFSVASFMIRGGVLYIMNTPASVRDAFFSNTNDLNQLEVCSRGGKRFFLLREGHGDYGFIRFFDESGKEPFGMFGYKATEVSDENCTKIGVRYLFVLDPFIYFFD